MADNNINLEKEKQFKELGGLIEKKGGKKEYAPEIKESGESELIEKAIENEGAGSYEENGEGGELGGIVAAGKQRKNKKARMKRIESILEKGLDDVYLAMPEENREKFKKEGEKTIEEINGLFEIGKATMKKIVNLIKKWLAVIPGVNRFFIEQEAKIKADEIINLNIKND